MFGFESLPRPTWLVKTSGTSWLWKGSFGLRIVPPVYTMNAGTPFVWVSGAGPGVRLRGDQEFVGGSGIGLIDSGSVVIPCVLEDAVSIS